MKDVALMQPAGSVPDQITILFMLPAFIKALFTSQSSRNPQTFHIFAPSQLPTHPYQVIHVLDYLGQVC